MGATNRVYPLCRIVSRPRQRPRRKVELYGGRYRRQRAVLMWQIVRDAMHYVERMGRTEWLVAGVIAMCIGFVLLRGFGSRVEY